MLIFLRGSKALSWLTAVLAESCASRFRSVLLAMSTGLAGWNDKTYRYFALLLDKRSLSCRPHNLQGCVYYFVSVGSLDIRMVEVQA